MLLSSTRGVLLRVFPRAMLPKNASLVDAARIVDVRVRP